MPPARGARYRERTSLRGLDVDGHRRHGDPSLAGRTRNASVRGGWSAPMAPARAPLDCSGVDRPVRMPRRLGLVAHYEGIDALRDRGEMHVGRAGYIGLAPLAHGRLNVGMALPLDGARRSAEERFARPSPRSRPWRTGSVACGA